MTRQTVLFLMVFIAAFGGGTAIIMNQRTSSQATPPTAIVAKPVEPYPADPTNRTLENPKLIEPVPPAHKPSVPVVPKQTEPLPTSPPIAPKALVRVSYIKDSILRKDDRVLNLLGGSVWLLERMTLALATDDIVIFLEDNESGIACVDGDFIAAKRVKGLILPETGLVGRVEKSLSRGAVLQLNDGSLWSVPNYDQYHTSFWLPPYPVIITSSQSKMINLKKMKTIWVERAK